MHTLSPDDGSNVLQEGHVSDTETQKMSKTVLLRMGGKDPSYEDRDSGLDVFGDPTIMSSIFAKEKNVSDRDGAVTPKG